MSADRARILWAKPRIIQMRQAGARPISNPANLCGTSEVCFDLTLKVIERQVYKVATDGNGTELSNTVVSFRRVCWGILLPSGARGEAFLGAGGSRLTWLECRVGPMKADDSATLAAFDGFFARCDLVWVALSPNVVELAAAIRVKH